MKRTIPFYIPEIGEKEVEEVINTLKSGWLTTGNKTKIFERKLENYLNVKHVLAVSSCTAALHLSIATLGIGKGDEVITSPFTFPSTVNVILYENAKPVFADIKEDTLNINPEEVKKKISDKTKAIIPVHYAGQSCEMEEILEIAEDYNVKVIEDAAHAIGAEYRGKKIGGFSDTTNFSFYATKNLTTGEGGAVATNNDEIAEKIGSLRLHGMSKDAWQRHTFTGSWYYEIIELGYKYNMSDIQASIGIHQLDKLEDFLKKRERIAKKYSKAFGEMDEIIIPHVKENIRHAWHLYPIQVNTECLKIDRNQFIQELTDENIGSSVHFLPVHLHPYYRNKFKYKRGDFPKAEYAYDHIISLPLYTKITEEELEIVIKCVKKIVKKKRRKKR